MKMHEPAVANDSTKSYDEDRASYNVITYNSSCLQFI